MDKEKGPVLLHMVSEAQFGTSIVIRLQYWC